MLIGNKEHFAFELLPVTPSWERRYVAEAAAWAGFAIWVNGRNLAAHVREGEETVRSYFYVPLGAATDWFVRSFPALASEERASWFPTQHGPHRTVEQWGERPPPAPLSEDEWLDRRADFWARHFLTSGADGARLPNVAFLRQDEEVSVSWAPPPQPAAPRVSMLEPRGQVSIRWDHLEASIDGLVAEVARHFREAGHPGAFPWVATAWREACAASLDQRLELFSGRPLAELAELLGVDTSQLADVLQMRGADPASSSICQIVRDLPPIPSKRIGEALLATVRRTQHAVNGEGRYWAEARSVARDAAKAGGTPQASGQLAASELRAVTDLDGEPIADMPAFAGRFGLSIERLDWRADSGERMVVAGLEGGRPAATVLRTERTATTWGQRFEIARALGHVLLDPLTEGSLGAASSPYAQSRRRQRAGAFAAELLVPLTALERAGGDRLDGAASPEVFAELLSRYGVGARTAANQLFNHRLLSSPTVRDDLIDQFAHDYP